MTESKVTKETGTRRVRPQGERLTIGYLAPNIRASPTQWFGIADAAQKCDVNLICFEGGSLVPHSGFQAQGSVLYDLASAESVDGLISWASLIGTRADADEVRAFHDRYRPLPMVTLGMTLDAIPSLFTDSYRGMVEAVVHLIEAHGHRRLAFVHGPGDSFYSQERYRAYTDALESHGLCLNPNLVAPPAQSWDPTDGMRTMRLLLDERGLRPRVDFEAVVAASDHLLLGALGVLREREIKVPGDVAAVGFDDIAQGRVNTPPFTTVVSPFYELGCQAVETLLALIEGVQVQQKTFVPTRLVIRQSCGCQPPAVTQVPIDLVGATGEKPEIASPAWRQEVLAAMVQATGEPLNGVMECAEQLLDGFSSAMEGTQDAFLLALDKTLRQVMAAGGNVAAWQGAISALRRHWFPYLDGRALVQAEDLWQQARVVIGETGQRMQAQRQLQAEQQARVLHEIGAELLTAFSMEKLRDAVATRLPSLGIPSCYISLYEDPKAPTEWSRLILAYNEKAQIELKPGGQRFPSRQLAPEGLMPKNRRYTMVAEPLYFQQGQIGLALFEVGPREGNVCDTLRVQLSSALEGALLLQKHRQVEEALARQTQSLARSNVELEQFAYVASHDLQEPLRMVTSYLQLIEQRYKGRLDADADEFIAYAVNGATRMQTLINDLLTYSRVGTKGKPFEPTDCTEALTHALTNLKIAIEESHTQVTHDPLPTVLADDVQLTQLFQNLVGNAIKFRSERTPEIHVGAESRDGEWQFSVHDNGIGIDPQHFERLFTIFQRLHTTAEYPGTGIGLAICKKIVERHDGRIWVESRPGQGSSFYFTIPDRQEARRE